VLQGWYPPLIFLGIGAMTDFSALIANPKLILIGAACQFGIFGAYIIALNSGFEPNQAGAIGLLVEPMDQLPFSFLQNLLQT
jgi:oxaloacetate decarboxylase beta subunit